jgi:hypothetical protein
MSRLRFELLAIVLLLPLPVLAQQPAQSFDQLGLLIQAGDKMTVTDTWGHDVTGRLARLDATTLSMAIEADTRTFDASQVRRIQKRTSDSVLNGAVMGAVIGGVATVLLTAIGCGNQDCDASSDSYVLVGLIGAGAGAGLGALFDAMVQGKRTVYDAPTKSSAAVSLVPVIGRARQGVLLNVRF